MTQQDEGCSPARGTTMRRRPWNVLWYAVVDAVVGVVGVGFVGVVGVVGVPRAEF